MALTIAELSNDFSYQHSAEKRPFGEVTGTITWDSSYPTGGEAVVFGDFDSTGLATAIKFLELTPSFDGTTHYRYDSSAGKIKAFNNNASQAVSETIETGLVPSSHVTTLAATPITITFVDAVAGSGTPGSIKRVHTDSTVDAGEFKWSGTSVTTNATDNWTDIDVGYLVQTAIVQEVANATDLSGANKVCFFRALLAG